jgi:hypothetical protein
MKTSHETALRAMLVYEGVVSLSSNPAATPYMLCAKHKARVGPIDQQVFYLKACTRLGSGVLVHEDTLRGIGGERRQSRSIQEDGRAIRADNPIALAHVEIDMRVIVGRRRTDACELPRTDLYLVDAQIVFELRVAGSLHGVLSGRRLLFTQRYHLSSRRSKGS